MDSQDQEAIDRSLNPADELREALQKRAPEAFGEARWT